MHIYIRLKLNSMIYSHYMIFFSFLTNISKAKMHVHGGYNLFTIVSLLLSYIIVFSEMIHY